MWLPSLLFHITCCFLCLSTSYHPANTIDTRELWKQIRELARLHILGMRVPNMIQRETHHSPVLKAGRYFFEEVLMTSSVLPLPFPLLIPYLLLQLLILLYHQHHLQLRLMLLLLLVMMIPPLPPPPPPPPQLLLLL
jgi:hypothetical protein